MKYYPRVRVRAPLHVKSQSTICERDSEDTEDSQLSTSKQRQFHAAQNDEWAKQLNTVASSPSYR